MNTSSSHREPPAHALLPSQACLHHPVNMSGETAKPGAQKFPYHNQGLLAPVFAVFPPETVFPSPSYTFRPI